ncbi:MAG: secretin N-terminal domain-containing protein [Rhizobiaceae bacterium]
MPLELERTERMKDQSQKRLIAVLCLAIVGLTSCTNRVPSPITQPLPIKKAAETDGSFALAEPEGQSVGRTAMQTGAGPAVPLGRATTDPLTSSRPPSLSGEPISVNFEGIRLPAFINTVFGELLKVNFEIDSTVAGREQIVTLRTAEPMSRDQFYALVVEVLNNYGITVIYSPNIGYRIVEATTVKKPIPRIVRTRTATSVPADLRPVFFFKPIDAIAGNTMVMWLNLMMGDRVQAINMLGSNGLILLGSAADVQAASDIIETLDQPYLAGSRSLKISPAFWSASRLTTQLIEIMTAEGYSIGQGGPTQTAIKLIPVEALNVVIAFGTSPEALQHLLQWATELDQPSQTVGSEGVFYHQVYNTKAADIADTVGAVLGGAGQRNQSQQAAPPPGSPAAISQAAAPTGRQRIIVDEPRNGIIFVGTAEEFAQFKSLAQQMDRAPLEVLIEATIAEVTLRDSEDLGIVLDYDDSRAVAPNQTVVRSDEGGIFFSLVRDRASILARVNALADFNRLQVLSSPRLVTSSGKPAAINVGTQVPIITSQETAAGQVGGNTSILQAIQYRTTGVVLNIEPVINSNRRVELNVSQEVSAAQENNLSSVQSPVIINRSITTSLSLNDGETVLLGGMISENFSKGNTGVPFLKDIPLLGNLFKTGSESINRTELIVLITPYIIDGPETARQVRDAFRQKLGEWAQEPAEPAPTVTPVAAPQ